MANPTFIVLTEPEHEHRQFLRSEVIRYERQLRNASEALAAYERQVAITHRLRAGERVPVLVNRSQKHFEIELVEGSLGVRFVQVFENGKRKRGESMMFGTDACNTWIGSLEAA